MTQSMERLRSSLDAKSKKQERTLSAQRESQTEAKQLKRERKESNMRKNLNRAQLIEDYR